jgi:hypothetical protein
VRPRAAPRPAGRSPPAKRPVTSAAPGGAHGQPEEPDAPQLRVIAAHELADVQVGAGHAEALVGERRQRGDAQPE